MASRTNAADDAVLENGALFDERSRGARLLGRPLSLSRWGPLLERNLQRRDSARFRDRDGRLGGQRGADESCAALLFRRQGGVTLEMHFVDAGGDALGQEQAAVAYDLGFLFWTVVP